MATITIVGLGSGPIGQLTKEAEAALLEADKIFVRTSASGLRVARKAAQARSLL